MKHNDNIIFCIDTSAFVDIYRYLIKFIPQLSNELDRLFNSGRLISHEVVYKEITTQSKRPDPLTKWILPRQAFFRDISLKQAIFVSDIIQRFPTLIHYNKEKDDADPWVVATVLESKSSPDFFSSLYKYAVVSAESKFIPNRLPAVCKHYQVTHMDVNEFFDANGWSIQLQTT
jgi:hypothetical protein